jgi:hypothetical protein
MIYPWLFLEKKQPVRAEDLDHQELLELGPEEGVIRFTGPASGVLPYEDRRSRHPR